ncbi:MAG: hypothetical protein M3020_03585 [Myxococcota bacterium]|nr:hypothetical protein [Myxococcota bacterium]
MDATEPLDPATGEPWQEALEPDSNFITDGAPIPASFAKPQRSSGVARVQTLAVHPLARFVETADVECAEGKKVCSVSPSDDGLVVETDAATLASKFLPSVELKTSASLFRVSNGKLEEAKLRLRLSVIECKYELRQLTRVYAGMSQVQSLFEVKRPQGSSDRCPEQHWDVGLRESGSTDVLASGTITIEPARPSRIIWESLPVASQNAPATYEIVLKYRGGQPVDVESVPRLVVGPAFEPLKNMRVLSALEQAPIVAAIHDTADITDRKSLDTGHENILLFGALEGNRSEWTWEVTSASAYFSACDRTVEDFKNRPQTCIDVAKPTTQVLELRASRRVPAGEILVPGASANDVAGWQQELELGFVQFSTGFSAKPYRVAANLEKHLRIRCGARWFDATSAGQPVSVDYDEFPCCELLFDPSEVQVHPRSAHLVDWQSYNANKYLRRFGSQTIEVRAGVVPANNSAPTMDLVERITLVDTGGVDKLQPCKPDSKKNTCIAVKLNMNKAAREARDYTLVHLEVKHVQAEYDATPESKLDSEFVVRIRRRPEWLAPSTNSGDGARVYGTFTVSPFSLFRAPHSGRGISKSSDAAKLEVANFGLGLVAVLEPWDFDGNEPFLPLLSPQLHAGVVSTLPTKTDLEYPTLSLVAGVGFRSGVDTKPDAAVESSLKLLLWYERLWTFQGRSDGTDNLLFGFGADIGTFGN